MPNDAPAEDDNERTIISILPIVLKHRVATYLEYGDIVRLLSRVVVSSDQQKQHDPTLTPRNHDRRPFQELCVSLLNPPQELFFSQVFRAEAFSRRDRIPVLSKNSTHSIRITCQYKDQGYGERLGRLYVIAKSLGVQTLSKRYKDGIVYMSQPAPHQYEDLEIIFQPREDEQYELLYRVGGQGHLLMVENLLVSTIVLDDHDHNNEAVYRKLCEVKMLDLAEDYDDEEDQDEDCNIVNHPNLVFGTKLLLAVAKTLSGGIADAEKCHMLALADFFEKNGVSTNRLNGISNICRFFLQHVDHHSTATNIQTIQEPSQEIPIGLAQKVDSTTNKQLPPFSLLTYGSWDESTLAQDIRIPVMPGGHTHSIRLTAKLKVEGSGEGKLHLVEMGGNDTTPNCKGVTRKTKIMTFSEAESLDFSFSPHDDNEYAYFLRVACDTNCSTSVENLMLHTAVLDNEGGQSLESTYQTFLKCGALDTTSTENRAFHLALLRAVATFLSAASPTSSSSSSSPLSETTMLASFLGDSCGFPANKDGLSILRDMSHMLMEFYDERKQANHIAGSSTTGSNRRDETGMMYWTHAGM